MRELEKKEIRKRGCDFCMDMKVGRKKKIYPKSTGFYMKMVKKCPYEKCPYTALDKYDTYGEFLKNEKFQFTMPRGKEKL